MNYSTFIITQPTGPVPHRILMEAGYTITGDSYLPPFIKTDEFMVSFLGTAGHTLNFYCVTPEAIDGDAISCIVRRLASNILKGNPMIFDKPYHYDYNPDSITVGDYHITKYFELMPKPINPATHLHIQGQTFVKGRPICKLCGDYLA